MPSLPIANALIAASASSHRSSLFWVVVVSASGVVLDLGVVLDGVDVLQAPTHKQAAIMAVFIVFIFVLLLLCSYQAQSPSLGYVICWVFVDSLFRVSILFLAARGLRQREYTSVNSAVKPRVRFFSAATSGSLSLTRTPFELFCHLQRKAIAYEIVGQRQGASCVTTNNGKYEPSP